MIGTPATAHVTIQHRTLTPATARSEAFGWSCSATGCPVGMTGYSDQNACRTDAADHERRQAMALFDPGTLVVPVGPGGSGKSRFAAMFPRTWVVCLDELREQVSDDFSVKFSMLRES